MNHSSARIIDKIPIRTIVEVHGPAVIIGCKKSPSLHQSLKIYTSNDNYRLEAHQNIVDQHHERALILRRASGLQRGLDLLGKKIINLTHNLNLLK